MKIIKVPITKDFKKDVCIGQATFEIGDDHIDKFEEIMTKENVSFETRFIIKERSSENPSIITKAELIEISIVKTPDEVRKCREPQDEHNLDDWKEYEGQTIGLPKLMHYLYTTHKHLTKTGETVINSIELSKWLLQNATKNILNTDIKNGEENKQESNQESDKKTGD